MVDLAGEVALEAPHDLGFALALGGVSGHVGLGRFMPVHPGDHSPVQRGVGLSVSAAVEPVPGGLAGGGWHRVGAAQGGEGGLAVQPLGVVPGAEQQRRGGVRADSGQLDQRRRGRRGELDELLAQGLSFGAQGLSASSQQAQGVLGGGQWCGERARAQGGTAVEKGDQAQAGFSL